MKTLLVYDLEGYIVMGQSGAYRIPVGLPYIEAEIPEGYYAESVDVERKEAILAENPKSETEQRLSELENLVQAMLGTEE